MLEQLEAPMPATAPPAPRSAPYEDDDRLPAPLHPYFGPSYRALKWRWMAPGVHCIRATGTKSGTLLMLKIGPGRSMPVHSHGGTELTQILRGAYHDALGHFAPGDVADLDSDVEHQPVTVPGIACICVSALDAPLRFPGWLARRLQPLFKL
jgi:putative transcriptional regulator